MLKKITLAGLLAVSMLTAGSAAAAPDNDGDGFTRAFAVDLDRSKPNDAIAAVLAAGHAELAAACEEIPDGAVRIVNPLASGDFTDVSCANILGGASGASGASATLTSDPAVERIGESRQGLGFLAPFLCGIVSMGLLKTHQGLCERQYGGNSPMCVNSHTGLELASLATCILLVPF